MILYSLCTAISSIFSSHLFEFWVFYSLKIYEKLEGNTLERTPPPSTLFRCVTIWQNISENVSHNVENSILRINLTGSSLSHALLSFCQNWFIISWVILLTNKRMYMVENVNNEIISNGFQLDSNFLKNLLESFTVFSFLTVIFLDINTFLEKSDDSDLIVFT